MVAADQQVFGHPRGLYTLFFTEVWERFSYYGMRGLLVLFMTDLIANGGMGMAADRASAIVGLYAFGVYALALPGGWIADRLIGQRKAVLVGGVIIALGHFTLAIPTTWAFFGGLVLVVLGTGLLKPNVSAMVGDLYSGDAGTRRDAGFSIFYMGINIGAMMGPIICGILGERVSWHAGFGAAGVGMTLGLIQYVAGGKYLGDAGSLKRTDPSAAAHAADWGKFYKGLVASVILIGGFLGLVYAGIVNVSLVTFGQYTGVIVVSLVFLYFAYVIAFDCKDAIERKRVAVIAALFVGAAMFWSGFEQASTSLNLFANDLTDRNMLGWLVPTSWFQSINALFIIIMAPIIGALWVYLGSRSPSLGLKFAYGLILLGIGFLVLAWGSTFAEAGKVSPMWLIVTYFFHTIGELCLSPVGLSATTKLSPHRLVGQMMGIWFMGAALGNLIAGLVGGLIESLPTDKLFGAVAAFSIGCGVLFLIFTIPIRKLSEGID